LIAAASVVVILCRHGDTGMQLVSIDERLPITLTGFLLGHLVCVVVTSGKLHSRNLDGRLKPK
jgi:hypothetical protein